MAKSKRTNKIVPEGAGSTGKPVFMEEEVRTLKGKLVGFIVKATSGTMGLKTLGRLDAHIRNLRKEHEVPVTLVWDVPSFNVTIPVAAVRLERARQTIMQEAA